MKETTWLKITPARVESNDLDFESAFELLLSALRQYALTLVQAHPEAKEEVYDWINQGTSGILHEIDPEKDPNPDIDINEVIAKQDLYIHTQLDNLKQNNPRRYKKALKQVRQMQSDQRAKILEKNMRTRQVSIDDYVKSRGTPLADAPGRDPNWDPNNGQGGSGNILDINQKVVPCRKQ